MRWTWTFALLLSAFQLSIIYSSTPTGISATSPAILFGREVAKKVESKCGVGAKTCPNVNSTTIYCCGAGKTCHNIENNTAAVCCEEGVSCGTLRAEKCSGIDFDLDGKKEQCGVDCCPIGYECIPGQTALKRDCKIKAHNLQVVPPNWADNQLVAAKEVELTITRGNCTNLMNTEVAAALKANKFPAIAIIVGFFPGIFVGVLLTFSFLWLLRCRQRAQQEKLLIAQLARNPRRRKRDSIFDDSLTYNPEREKDLFAIPRGFSLKRKPPIYDDPLPNPFTSHQDPHPPPISTHQDPHPASAAIEHPPRTSTSSSRPTSRSSSRPRPDPATVLANLDTTTMPRSFIIPPEIPPSLSRKNSLQSIISDHSTPPSATPPAPPPKPKPMPAPPPPQLAKKKSGRWGRMRSGSSSKGQSKTGPGGGGGGGGTGKGMWDVEEDVYEEDWTQMGPDEVDGAVAGRQRARDGRGEYEFVSPTVPKGLFRGGLPGLD